MREEESFSSPPTYFHSSTEDIKVLRAAVNDDRKDDRGDDVSAWSKDYATQTGVRLVKVKLLPLRLGRFES